MRTKRALLLVLLGAVAPMPAAAQSGVQEIDAYLEQAVEAGIPGIVAMVADAEGVLYEGAFGKQDVAANVPMSMDTIFRIASMTKPITSLAAVMLIEQGQVGLDDPISRYLPELAGKEVIEDFDPSDGSFTTRPAAGEITIRHLLTNTSGLAYAFSNEIMWAVTGGDPFVDTTSFPLIFDPGTRWAYSGATRVLGTLVAELSGRSLDEFFAERLFEPLGMNDTSYTVPAAKHDRVVTIHRTTAEGLVEAPNPQGEISAAVAGDAGLHSTAADYVEFIQLFLNGGRAADGTLLLSEAWTGMMGADHTGSVRVERQPAMLPEAAQAFPLGAGRDGFGLGFQVTGTPAEPGMRSPGSMSWAGIFNTEFWIDPEAGIGAVLLMQYLPFYDEVAIETLQGFERRVYRHLAD